MNKNLRDVGQKGKISKKELEHQNYRRQKEGEKLKEELLLRSKEEAEREQKRLEKKADERKRVEALKYESLLQQADVILTNGKRKHKRSKAEASLSTEAASLSTEPVTEEWVSSSNNNAAEYADVKMGSGDNVWCDDIWDESCTNTQVVSTLVVEEPHFEKKKYENNRPGGFRPKLNQFPKTKGRRWDNGGKADHTYQHESTRLSSKEYRRTVSEASSHESTHHFEKPFNAVDAPEPEVNIWEERQSKMESIELMKPHNDFEEDAMLHQALELSRLQALEDQKHRNEIQEEYYLQMKCLLENPELAAELEEINDACGATASPGLGNDGVSIKNSNCSEKQPWFGSFQNDDGIWGDENRCEEESKVKKSCYNSNDWYEREDVGVMNEARRRRKGTSRLSEEQSVDETVDESCGGQGSKFLGAKPKYKSFVSEAAKVLPQNTEPSVPRYDDDGIWDDVPDSKVICNDNDKAMPVQDTSQDFEENASPEKGTSEDVDHKPMSRFAKNLSSAHQSDGWDDEVDNPTCKSNELHNAKLSKEMLEYGESPSADFCAEYKEKENSEHFTKSASLRSKRLEDNSSPVRDPVYTNYDQANEGVNTSKNLERDTWDDDLQHMLKSVKGVHLTSDTSTSFSHNNSISAPVELESKTPVLPAIEPAITEETIRAMSALQENSVKNAMANVEKWLASTQSEAQLAERYSVSEKNEPFLCSAKLDVPEKLPSSANGQFLGAAAAAAIQPQPDAIQDNLRRCLPNAVPPDDKGTRQQVPLVPTTIGMPFMPPSYPSVMPSPMPMDPASVMWQQAVMCSNPFLMQQLHALQMFYVSLGVPAPNGFLPFLAPSSISPQANESNFFTPQQEHSGFNVPNMVPITPQYRVDNPVQPQYTMAPQCPRTTINPPIATDYHSKPQNMPLPPGINTGYFQAEAMNSFAGLQHDSVSLPVVDKNANDGFVGIPPPRPATDRRAMNLDAIRQPKHKFNDICPLLQQSRMNPNSQNGTAPKTSEQTF